MLNRQNHSHSRGLTLIELAVTVSILGLLVLATAPSIGEWLRNTQIRNVATSIQSGLQRARNEALRRNQPVRFSLVSLTDSAVMDNSCALASAPSWVVSLNDPTGKCGVAASDTTDPMIVERSAGGIGGKNVGVAAITGAPTFNSATSIAFDGFGRVSGAVATPLALIEVDDITAGANYRALRVVISSGGSIRMCDPKVTNANDPRKCI